MAMAKTKPHGTADDWPAWTDAERWELGPGPDEPTEAYRAEAAGWNVDWHHDGPTPAEVVDLAARGRDGH